MMASRLASSGSSLPMMVSRSDEYCDSPAAREDEGAQPPTARVPAAKEGGRRRIDPPEAQVPAVEEGGPIWEAMGDASAGLPASIWEAREQRRRSGRRGATRGEGRRGAGNCRCERLFLRERRADSRRGADARECQQNFVLF